MRGFADEPSQAASFVVDQLVQNPAAVHRRQRNHSAAVSSPDTYANVVSPTVTSVSTRDIPRPVHPQRSVGR